MSNGPKKSDYSHLFVAIGGIAAGYLYSRSELAESKKSRAEKDHPDLVEEVCEEVAELIDEWEPDEDCESENEFTEDLASYIKENSELTIEVFPGTPEGKPDILIDNVLALELKVGLGKSERDRLIGQCAGYSRKWVTWTVIIDASPSQLGSLSELLEDKGLEHILVWEFNEDGG